MTSPAEKLRRGEYPEFNSGPLQGVPPLPSFEPSSAVSEVKAAAAPKQEVKLTVLPSKKKETPKANVKAPAVAKQIPLYVSPTSLSLANIAGFGQRITPQEIGPMNVHPQNILGGAIKGWHIGFSRSWRFISDTPDFGIKMGLYPIRGMGINERTAGINVHELERDNTADRWGEFGMKADTGVQLLVGRADDGSAHLPLQLGRAAADGTFSEIARLDTVNDRMGVGQPSPAEKLHVGGVIRTDQTLKVRGGTGFDNIITGTPTGTNTHTLPDKSGTLAHTSDIPATLAPTAITPVNTDKLLGRDTAGTGAAEEIAVGGGIEFTGGPGIQRSALTGDVTASAGSGSTTIANSAVSNAKQADMADSTIKGRAAGAGTGAPTDLTAAQVLAILGIGSSVVEAHTSDDTLTAAETGSMHTNEGAGGLVQLTLPSAAAGLRFQFYIDAAQTMRIIPAAGDSVRVLANVGTTNSNAATVGHAIEFKAINATEWVATSFTGTWTVV